MLRIAPLILALAVISGCASVSVSRDPGVEPVGAGTLAADGDHAGAARAWRAAAADSRGAARDHAWLMAADQHWLAGEADAARAAWSEVNRRRLDDRDLAYYAFLDAAFLGKDGRDGEALARLATSTAGLPPELRARWLTLRAELSERSGRRFDAAADLAVLGEGGDRAARAETMRRIDRLLAEVADADLAASAAALPDGHPLYPQAARQLQRRGLPLPRPLARGASTPGLDALPPADTDGYRPPTRLAVLLPLSGPLAAAGNSVRDGVLAGYYGERRRRPELKFYDTAGNADGLRRALDSALADGADMLVGPLTRDEVNLVFELPNLDRPTIALNRGTLPPPAGSTTFAMAPEDEGAAAADRLADRGLRRVLVVSQSDDTARRAVAAFRTRLRERGGELVGEATVSEATPDFIPALQQAMGGGRPDAIFLALKAAPARLLASQMETAGLLGIPRVATSLIQSGANLRMDTELDGIEYPELPWLLGLGSSLPDADTVGQTLPSAKGGGARLFAFGADAWRLAGYLDHLLTDPTASVNGATGELMADDFGGIARKPGWAVFSGGRPRPAMDGALMPEPVPPVAAPAAAEPPTD